MLALEPPFALYSKKMMEERVFERGQRPKIYNRWTPRVESILKQAWAFDYKERPTMKEVANAMRDELAEIDPNSPAL